MDPKIIAAIVLLLLCCSSSIAAMTMGGGDDTSKSPSDSSAKKSKEEPEEEPEEEPAPPPAPPAPPRERFEWRIESGVDYPYNDLFHYHRNSTPIGSEAVCLDKCAEMDNCKFVTFNPEKTLCWGKHTKGNQVSHGGRVNYFKE